MSAVRAAAGELSWWTGKPREVSVTSLYRAAQEIGAKGNSVPYLRLSGRWLERLGFASGCRVVVTEERGKLTLTLTQAAAD